VLTFSRSKIERMLMATPEVGRNYVILLGGLDDLTVKVELGASGFDGQVEHLAACKIDSPRASGRSFGCALRWIWYRPARSRLPMARQNACSISARCSGTRQAHDFLKRNPVDELPQSCSRFC
jgi:hypothetical protein